MRTFLLFAACFALGAAFWAAPWPATGAALGAGLLLCWYVNLRLGPLVRAAERAAKAFAGPGTCIPEMQELGRIAFRRRAL